MSERKDDKPKYWLDIENPNVKAGDEFAPGIAEEVFDIINAKKSRRDFLSVLGFSVAAPVITSCNKVPVKKALGFLNREDKLTPGVAQWYASTCGGCEASCGTIVKTREGRPIKIEGNPDSPFSKGGLCAVGQASVLSLYDSVRFNQPKNNGKDSNWSEVDAAIPELLKKATGKIALVTGRINSPSTLAVVARFKQKYPSVEHIPFEPFSYSALIESFERTHGMKALPEYSLNGVESLVAVGADFLSSWYRPVAFAKGYAAARDVHARHGKMLRHIQFEAGMSVAGSNADIRVPVKASEESHVLAALLKEVAASAGRSVDVLAPSLDARVLAAIKSAAADLWKNRGASLVLSGSNRVDDQAMVNAINEMLGNIGSSVKLMPASEVAYGSDGRFEALVAEMAAGKVGALITTDVNPAYAYYSAERWEAAIAKVPLQISLAEAPNETNKGAQFICPGNHALESWNDHQLAPGKWALTQPTIQPLRSTRMMQESLLKWSGETPDFYEFIRGQWKSRVFSKAKHAGSFESFWNQAVQNGGVETDGVYSKPAYHAAKFSIEPKTEGADVLLYQKTGMRDGRHASNPWLQELPDPITKATWDNYAMLSADTAKSVGVKNGDVVSVTKDKVQVTLPVLVQAGLGTSTVAIAVGYGRRDAGKTGTGVGQNAYPFGTFANGSFQRFQSGVQITKASGTYELALTQTHHVMEGRDLVREVNKADLHKAHGEAHHGGEADANLWPEHKPGENRWGMAIDLAKCTGCSACVIGCQSENNIPVVGREEVRLRREMHWIRLDRYYTGDEASPGVVHQPVMCHHCENAPCETVCPVLATVHSSDGLNQQVYNRCVGTRYCANNCPYKVRRFNWFDYNHDDPWGRMVLNPDITVRSRGVMEKCSFCIQRIQEGRLKAKKEGRKIADGDFKTACQQSCPSDAIVFGDLANPESLISKSLKASAGYQLLEEINVRPRVSFLPKVRNPL